MFESSEMILVDHIDDIKEDICGFHCCCSGLYLSDKSDGVDDDDDVYLQALIIVN